MGKSKQLKRSKNAETSNSAYDFQNGEPLTAYVADMSYFSGKLEAYLRYREIPYNRRLVNVNVLLDEVYSNTRMMKVPVVRLPDGQWLKDTTPMIQWFEEKTAQQTAQKAGPGVFPPDPVSRFLALLVEDYADEWCWRSALYWRWCFPESRKTLSFRLGREILADWPVPKGLAGWYFGRRQIQTYLKGDGLTKQTAPFIERHYLDMIDAMQMILDDQPYLMGSQPGIADFGMFGPMFRHFGLDPTPARVMLQRAPAVYEWLARLWNARASKFSKFSKSTKQAKWTDFKHPGWNFFLKDIVQIYWPFLNANAAAWQFGESRLDFQTPEVTFRNLKVVHYRVYCLEMLQREYHALSRAQQAKVQKLLSPYGDFDVGGPVDSGLRHEFVLPLPPKPANPSAIERLLLTMTGTPWDLPGWLKPMPGKQAAGDS